MKNIWNTFSNYQQNFYETQRKKELKLLKVAYTIFIIIYIIIFSISILFISKKEIQNSKLVFMIAIFLLLFSFLCYYLDYKEIPIYLFPNVTYLNSNDIEKIKLSNKSFKVELLITKEEPPILLSIPIYQFEAIEKGENFYLLNTKNKHFIILLDFEFHEQFSSFK